MEVEIRGFQGIIIKLDSLTEQIFKELDTKKLNESRNIKTINIISYEVTLYIQDRDATIKLENVMPEEIKVLKEKGDYLQEFKKNI